MYSAIHHATYKNFKFFTSTITGKQKRNYIYKDVCLGA